MGSASGEPSDSGVPSPVDKVLTSNNDATWVDDHNGVSRLEVIGSSIEAEQTLEYAPAPELVALEAAPRDEAWQGSQSGSHEPLNPGGIAEAPPLPEETAPPLPEENAPPLPEHEDVPPLPSEPLPQQNDGWAPIWEPTTQAYYFYNSLTGATQWDNPRVPAEVTLQPGPPGVDRAVDENVATQPPPSRPAGGYDPAVHGDYDPNAWYAQTAENESEQPAGVPGSSTDPYAATGTFNRFTGRWQAAEISPENFNDENKSKRQMNAFFDVDAAANSHDGKSLKAERSGKKLSKTELKEFKKKRKEKKETKRRAWLMD